jgi:N-dimethylarginine dimethylaminohydrolase
VAVTHPAPPATTEYDAWMRRLQEREWTLADVPFYEPGRPPDVARLHDLDYLDVYPQVYGRRIGSNGIGKLVEAGLTRIREYERPPLWDEDPAWFEGVGIDQAGEIDAARMQAQQEDYAGQLEANGVAVHWIDWPDPPMSAFGPMQHMWAAQELLIINGGSIIPKMGWSPYSFGRTEYLARWAFFHLGIPPLVTITGKGVNEAGASLFLAQDVYLTAISAAYNEDGLEQLIPVMRRTAGVEPFHVQVMKLAPDTYFDRSTGLCAHPDIVVGPLDVRKALVFSPSIDADTLEWLRRMGYELVEVDFEEHLRCYPANLTILEPGLVMIHADAPRTIAAVRAAGVEVIEVPYSEFHKAGGGLACATQLILREPGPSLGLG